MLDSIIKQLLYMFKTTWVLNLLFPTGKFMKSKYRFSIFDTNLASKLRWAITIEQMLESEDLGKTCKIVH